MSDTRKPEETICPLFTLTQAVIHLANMFADYPKEIPEGDVHINLTTPFLKQSMTLKDLEEPCRGKPCHMYETGSKKCGLRFR